MSLHLRPARREQGGNVTDDLSAVLNIAWPRTECEWAAWRDQRARYRSAIATWAVQRGKTDPGFDVWTEMVQMIQMLGLRLADDQELYHRYRRLDPVDNGRRAIVYRDRRGG